MPYRNRQLSRPIERWLLPGFAGLGVIAIAIWTVWGIETVHGLHRASTGELLLIAAFAGLGLLLLFGTAVAVVIVQSAVFDARVVVHGELLALVGKLEEAGILTPPGSPHWTRPPAAAEAQTVTLETPNPTTDIHVDPPARVDG